MKQQYSVYNENDQQVWSTLFNRQQENLKLKACLSYLNCLEEMHMVLNGNKIPDFKELNAILGAKTGWSIEVVQGLIPPEDFFELLAKKRFCSSVWLRTMDQLDYLEEPDMFHDIFGHIPLLMDPSYAQFMEAFGSIGVQNLTNKKVVTMLQRLYWFTIEFGLIDDHHAMDNKIYGAGIASSFGETNHSLSSSVEIMPFNLKEVISTSFCTSEKQLKYFKIESFDQLSDALIDFQANEINS